MIGNDHVERAFAECAPKLFAIFAFADRRTTLEFSGAIGNIFRCKSKIVRTRLRRNASVLHVSPAASNGNASADEW